MAAPDAAAERRALGLSIGAATAIGVLGIAVGVLTGSSLVLLDGAYAFIGVAVSWLLVLVSRLVGKGPTHAYPYGREALTPMVVGVQGFVLLGTVLYAVVEAVQSILEGGSSIAAGWALAYAVVTTSTSLLVWRRLAGAAPGSDLVGAEAEAWRVSAFLGFGMVVGFVVLLAADGSRWSDATPYVDPALVLVCSAVLLPSPLRMVRSTFVELLEGAPPPEMQAPVRAAVDEVLGAHRLADPVVRMTKIGPKLYLEVDAPADPATTIAREDEVRRALERRLEDLPFDVWLNLELFPGPVPDPPPAAP